MKKPIRTVILAALFALAAGPGFGGIHYKSVTKTQPEWDLGASANSVTGVADCNDGSKCLTMKIDYLTEGGDANAWQHYRYRVYETTVPLRNIIWNAGT